MPLNRGEVNPLGVLGMRKVSFIPEHFKSVTLDQWCDVRMIEFWINYNLNGRYAIKNKLVIDKDNKLIEVTEIGLEDPKEILLFSLGCPYIHNKKELW